MNSVRRLWSDWFGLGRTLRMLKHPSARVRERADHRFWRHDWNLGEAIMVLKAAAEEYPDENTSKELLRRCSDDPCPEFIPVVEQIYDQLESRQKGREWAIRILIELMSEESMQAILRLLKRESSRTFMLHGLFNSVSGGMSKRSFIPIASC